MIFTLQRKQFHHYLQLKHANHELITLRNLAKARKRDQILRSSSHGSHMMNIHLSSYCQETLTVCVTNGLFVYSSFQLGLGGQGKDAKASRPNPASQGQGKGLGLKTSLVRSQCLCVSVSSPQSSKAKRKVI